MLKKSQIYRATIFTPEILQEVFSFARASEKKDAKESARMTSLSTGGTEWHYDSDEEFYVEYHRGFNTALIWKTVGEFRIDVTVRRWTDTIQTEITVSAPSRARIESIYNIFDKNVERCKVPILTKQAAVSPTIFIGHGRVPQWRDLKDHLHEQHGYDVQSYEIGARAGHAIRDIIEDMLDKSSFAILVMTAEDRTEDGTFHPRLNVVHELGLFQGRLGFTRAIVLLEEGTEEFSNIHGIHQIRYSKTKIKETFGDVLATLKREFAPSDLKLKSNT